MDELKEIIKENTITIDRLTQTFQLHMNNLMDSSMKIERLVNTVENIPENIKVTLMKETEDIEKEMYALTRVISDYNENERSKNKRKFLIELIKYILPFATLVMGYLSKSVVG